MANAAIYPGTFDPLTHGHLDVIERAALIFDRLTVGVATGRHKAPLFEVEERVDLIQGATSTLPNVEVECFDGLLVNYARNKGVGVLIRGLRAFSDFEYEFQMALTNRKMAPDVETMFLMPKEDFSYISSTMVREIAELGGEVRDFVPDVVAAAIQRKTAK